MYEQHELSKVDAALKESPFITVHCAHPSWIVGTTVKGWTCVIEHENNLSKATTYDEELAFTHGLIGVEFYKNRRGERCIRKG